jgi:hypothetical protein
MNAALAIIGSMHARSELEGLLAVEIVVDVPATLLARAE